MLADAHSHLLTAMVVLALSAPSGAAAQTIGAPEWTSQEALGQPPEAEQRTLTPGLGVILREAVTTDPRGAADFIFYNSARLLVGPDCAVTLDERFYDPELDLEVVSVEVETDTFCVSRIDEVRALRTADQAPVGVSQASLNSAFAMQGEDVPANTPATLIATEVGSLLVAGGSTVFSVRPDGDGASIVKTSPEGIVIVRTERDTAVIRRAGFDVEITSNGEIIGPRRTSPATIMRLQASLERESDVGPAADLPFVLEPPDSLRTDIIDLAEPSPIDPPDACALTDTCLGLERIVEIDDDGSVVVIDPVIDSIPPDPEG